MNRICTIIAVNYLPQAIALLESTRQIYPEIEFWVLVTDATSKDIPFLPTANVLLPEDLVIPEEWLADMRSYYDQVELATALKPFLLSTLLSSEVSTVTYLDPDILLYSELTEGFSAARESGIALAPHRLTPSNILLSEFGELDFLRYGIFNLGYICVGQRGRAMLLWWEERLRWYCTRFPLDVVFTDQKWMNFVPALFDFKVIRNFGYDFAPWNLDERALSKVHDQYFVNESPLIFIHFSQMSGGLAAGRGTDSWERAHKRSNQGTDSLRIINDLTDAYAMRLIDLKEEVMNWSIGNTRDANRVIPNFHRRQKLIQISLNRERGLANKSNLYLHRNPFRGRLSGLGKILERSTTLNGMRLGFSEDLGRLSRKFQVLSGKSRLNR